MIALGTCSPCFLEHIYNSVMILSHQIFYFSSLSLSLTTGIQELTLTWHCKLLSTLDLQSGKFLDQGPLPASPSLSIFFRTIPMITKEVLGPHLIHTGHCSSSLQFPLEDKGKSASEIHWQKPTKAIQHCATVPRRAIPKVYRLQLPSAWHMKPLVCAHDSAAGQDSPTAWGHKSQKAPSQLWIPHFLKE